MSRGRPAAVRRERGRGDDAVLDIASGEVVARIPVGREPEGVVATPNGRWVVVTNESDNSVSFIDRAR